MSRIRRGVEQAGTVSALALGVLGCGMPARQAGRHPPSPAASTSPVAAPSPEADPCELVPLPTTRPESIAVASTTDVDPSRVPHAVTAGERLVFSQLYETLLRVDCAGRLVPALASSWTADESGRRWTVVLRDGARFRNGDVVTADDVLASWRATAATPAGELARSVGDAAAVLDERSLVVTLPEARPLVLADPALAIYRERGDGGWADGTTPWRPDRGAASGEGVRLTIGTVPAAGARDLVDLGIDVLVTDDPAAIAYAAVRPELVSVPLPWERTYALLIPGRARVSDGTDGPGEHSASLSALRAALARDAVRIEARAAAPEPWLEGGACDAAHAVPPPSPAPPRRSRIVYVANDDVARALAERLIALAAFRDTAAVRGTPLAALAPHRHAPGAPPTAIGLSSLEFAAALRAGNELAYIAALPITPHDRCGPLPTLRDAAPWLALAERDHLARALIPLVDTRSRVIVRRDRVGVMLMEGSVLLVGGGQR